jgi:flagellar hook-basal body complex protein FliE
MEQVLIERLRDLTPSLEGPSGSQEGAKAGGADFAKLMSGLISDVNDKQNLAAANAEGVATGEVDIMDAVVSLNDADLSLRMMMQIRDRAMDAYQRILRTI